MERHQESIQRINVTRHPKQRRNQRSRQIVFDGERLDAWAVWGLRDEYIGRRDGA